MCPLSSRYFLLFSSFFLIPTPPRHSVLRRVGRDFVSLSFSLLIPFSLFSFYLYFFPRLLSPRLHISFSVCLFFSLALFFLPLSHTCFSVLYLVPSLSRFSSFPVRSSPLLSFYFLCFLILSYRILIFSPLSNPPLLLSSLPPSGLHLPPAPLCIPSSPSLAP